MSERAFVLPPVRLWYKLAASSATVAQVAFWKANMSESIVVTRQQQVAHW